MVVLWLTVCSKSSKDECCQVNVEVPWSDEPLFTLSSARRSARRLHDQTWTRACGVVRLRSVCTFIRRYPFCQRFGVKISLLDLLKIPCCEKIANRLRFDRVVTKFISTAIFFPRHDVGGQFGDLGPLRKVTSLRCRSSVGGGGGIVQAAGRD